MGLLGTSDSIGKRWWQKILTQPKVLETEEYCMYFPFLELRGWGKGFAAQPQTIYSEIPLRISLKSRVRLPSSRWKQGTPSRWVPRILAYSSLVSRMFR